MELAVAGASAEAGRESSSLAGKPIPVIKEKRCCH